VDGGGVGNYSCFLCPGIKKLDSQHTEKRIKEDAKEKAPKIFNSSGSYRQKKLQESTTDVAVIK